MAREASRATKKDENKVTVIGLADDIIDLCDKLDTKNAEALAKDYADDGPRNEAVRGLDDLHRGLYGVLSDRVHAQVTFIMTKLTEQEKMDRENDVVKQGERPIIQTLKEKARTLRNEYRAR